MNLVSKNETVVLLHGLWLPAYCLWPLARRLECRGFAVHRYAYASVRVDLTTNAARLARFLSEIDADCVHLVGHSLGGVLIRALFHDHPDQKPGRIVTLGTPHGGSRVARHLSRHVLWRRALGRGVAQLLSGDVHDWALPAREIGVISGTHSFGMGRFLYPGLPRPNDGLLAGEECALPGARDSLALPVSHTGMLFSRRVAIQLGHFLQHGMFER
ncbi:MAG: esterase/lipase family protein [Sulfuricaulis sp.]